MKAWPLPKLLATCRHAGAVALALAWLAQGGRQVNTTRKTIREVCGLSEKLITAGIHSLKRAGWIRVAYGFYRSRTWYRIVLVHEGLKTTFMGTSAMRGAKRPSCKRQGRSKNDLHGGAPMRGAKRPPLSTERRDAAPAARAASPHVQPEHEFLPDDPGPDAESTVAFLTRMGVLRPEGGKR